ncbi:hypothetical protein DFJ74DRAFT_693703 [Hyaloraphidium curvatum]|nr:hypothetical protein DFJ74DRAFT_693703 [Hyaloraphidium curvatum]
MGPARLGASHLAAATSGFLLALLLLPAPPCAPCGCDPAESSSLRAQLDSLRAQFSRAACRDENATAASGAWCVFPSQKGEMLAPGHPMAREPHWPADAGMAGFLLRLFPPGCEVLDLGAGVGQYGHYFAQRNASFSWRGVDGALNGPEFTRGFVAHAELSVPIAVRSEPFDWVMSLEVAEHLPKKAEPVFLDNVARHAACGAVISWAVPGQGGHGHLNERPASYVAERMKELGFVDVPEATADARKAAKYWWLQRTAWVFRRAEPARRCRPLQGYPDAGRTGTVKAGPGH